MTNNQPKALTPDKGLYDIQNCLINKFNSRVVHHPLDIGVVYASLKRKRQPFFKSIMDLVKNNSNYSYLIILLDVSYDVPKQPLIRHSVVVIVKYSIARGNHEIDIFDSNGLESDLDLVGIWTFRLSEVLLYLKEKLKTYTNNIVIYDRFININSICDNWVHLFMHQRICNGMSQLCIDAFLENISNLEINELTSFANQITNEIINKNI